MITVLFQKQQRHQVSSAVHVHADEKSLGYERLQRRQNTDLLNMQVSYSQISLQKIFCVLPLNKLAQDVELVFCEIVKFLLICRHVLNFH